VATPAAPPAAKKPAAAKKAAAAAKPAAPKSPKAPKALPGSGGAKPAAAKKSPIEKAAASAAKPKKSPGSARKKTPASAPPPPLPTPRPLLERLPDGETKLAALVAWQFARAFHSELSTKAPNGDEKNMPTPTLEQLQSALLDQTSASAYGGVVGRLHECLLDSLLTNKFYDV